MSVALGRMAANGSELLRIAVGGQHTERWTSPRGGYPVGRAGYLKWRNDLKEYHARRLGEIMAAAGYAPQDAARVGALVRKERLRSDPEGQMLEHTEWIVFLTVCRDGFDGQSNEGHTSRVALHAYKRKSG